MRPALTFAVLPQIAKFLLVVTVGAAAGVAISTVWRQGLLQSAWAQWSGEPTTTAHLVGWAGEVQPRPAFRRAPADGLAAQPAAAAPGVRGAPHPRVATALLVGGRAHPADAGPVALPSGTRLQVRMTPNRSGRLELHAINPLGHYEGAALWASPATAGSTVYSPPLRLQGERGMETLRVVLRSPQGDVLLQEEMQLWHQ